MGETGEGQSAPLLCNVCKAPTQLKCSRCEAVFYCNKQHQVEDWPNHKRECCAYVIRTTDERGRYLVASRNIRAGYLILTEDSAVIGPCFFDPSPCCVGCCRNLPQFSVVVCPGCRLRVCSDSCLGLASPDRHPAECRILQAFQEAENQRYPAEELLNLRCARLQRDQPQKWERFRQAADYAVSKAIHKSRLKERISLGKFVSADGADSPSAEKIQAVLNVYSLDWTMPQGQMAGLYPNASFLQRSCVSNTALMIEGVFDKMDCINTNSIGKERPFGWISVYATRDISKGEILTWTSTHQLLTTSKRQQQLMAERNIRCSCARCLDPHELGTDFGTLKCPRCSGWVLPVDLTEIECSDWLCRGSCATKLTPQMVSDILSAQSKDLQTVEGLDGPGPRELLLAKLKSFLHPNHEFCFSLKLSLMKSYVDDPVHISCHVPDAYVKRKRELGCELLKVIDKLVPYPVKPDVAVMLTNFFQHHQQIEAEYLDRGLAGPLSADQKEKALQHCQSLLHRWMCCGTAAARSVDDLKKLTAQNLVQNYSFVSVSARRFGYEYFNTLHSLPH